MIATRFTFGAVSLSNSNRLPLIDETLFGEAGGVARPGHTRALGTTARMSRRRIPSTSPPGERRGQRPTVIVRYCLLYVPDPFR